LHNQDIANAIAFGIAVGVEFLGTIVVLVALLAIPGAWINRRTTEIAVTTQRIIIKRGLFRRSTMEMNVGQIESVQVDQSIFGRLFGFGTVTLRGTGAGVEPIRAVAPLALRKAVGELAKG
jgi:uncharacterized membrane protein YdbT with pleckstrin-like domain